MIVRGAIHAVDFEPVRGSESDKRRPAIVVSNDAANASAERLGRGVITVVPVTSSITRVYRFQVLLPAAVTGLPLNSKAQAEQVRAVDVGRIGPQIGAVAGPFLEALEDALRLHLGL